MIQVSLPLDIGLGSFTIVLMMSFYHPLRTSLITILMFAMCLPQISITHLHPGILNLTPPSVLLAKIFKMSLTLKDTLGSRLQQRHRNILRKKEYQHLWYIMDNTFPVMVIFTIKTDTSGQLSDTKNCTVAKVNWSISDFFVLVMSQIGIRLISTASVQNCCLPKSGYFV